MKAELARGVTPAGSVGVSVSQEMSVWCILSIWCSKKIRSGQIFFFIFYDTPPPPSIFLFIC